MERIGVRELRQNASVYVKRVQLGERFQVTDRGTPVAELGPVTESPYDRLVRDGSIVPAAERFEPSTITPFEPAGETSASAVLAAMRDAERF